MEQSTILINIIFALAFCVIVLIYLLQSNRYKRKQLEQKFAVTKRESANFLKLTDHSGMILFAHDLSGKIEFINDTVQKLLGLNPKQLLNTSFRTLIADGYPHLWDDYIEAIFRDQQYRREFKLLNRDGLAVPFQIHATGIIDEGVVIAVKGYAQLIEKPEKTGSQNKVAEKPNMDSDLFGQKHKVFAHHLKNIFSAIFGFVEIIEEEAIESDAVKSAKSEIHAASCRGVELIDDFLKNRATAGKITEPTQKKINSNALVMSSSLKKGQGSILFIDDEKPLLKMYSKFILKLGYSVETCSSGYQAIEILSKKDQSYGLVISDWMIPDLGGKELVQKIKEIQPDIPVIILSGKNIPNEYLSLVHSTMQKPVDSAKLSEKIFKIFNSVKK